MRSNAALQKDDNQIKGIIMSPTISHHPPSPTHHPVG